MTPAEWTKVKEHVEALRGRKNRKWAQYGRVINEVGHVKYEDAIKLIDRSVGGYTPSPANIIAIKAPPTAALPAPVWVPRDCGGHRLELVDSPFCAPFMACRNTGCDYQTDKIGDHEQ